MTKGPLDILLTLFLFRIFWLFLSTRCCLEEVRCPELLNVYCIPDLESTAAGATPSAEFPSLFLGPLVAVVPLFYSSIDRD